MINSISVQGGFAAQLPSIEGRTFKFNDKFNVLYGSNGIGKSTLIKIMAGYCGIEKGGWSRISDPAKLAVKFPSHFPYVYRQYAMGCDATIDRNGKPVFYNDSEMLGKNDLSWFMNPENSTDGMTTEAEQMDLMIEKPSSGQYRIHKINKIMQVIKYPPDLTVVPPHVPEKEYAQMEVDYIKGLSPDGKVTLLLDEPEKALALPKQLELFDVLNKLSVHFQVIIATHSPFVLFYKGVNIIDMESGYAKQCKDLIKKQVNGNKKIVE